MAVWHYHFVGLKVHGEDPFGLPITEKVNFIYEYKGNNFMVAEINAPKEARQWAKERSIFSIECQRVERIDKPKVYDSYGSPNEPLLILNKKQRGAVEAIREAVRRKYGMIGYNETAGDNLIHASAEYLAFFKHVNIMWSPDSREAALQVAKSLVTFFTEATNDEIEMLLKSQENYDAQRQEGYRHEVLELFRRVAAQTL